MIDCLEHYLNTVSDNDIDIPAFVMEKCPELVADPEGLSGFLYSDRPQRQIGDFILACNKAIGWLENNRSHSKGHKPNYYDAYIRFADPSFAVSKKDFHLYFKYINNLELNRSLLKIHQKTIDIIGLLRKENIGDDLIKEAYLKLCSNSNVVPADLWHEIDPFCFQSDDKYIEITRKFNSSLSTSFNSIIDFFACLYFREDCNDVLLENQFLFPRIRSFFSVLDARGPVLFIDPDYYFIKKIAGSRYCFGDNKTVFFIKDTEIADVLNRSLPLSSKFIFKSISDFGETIDDPAMAPSLTVFFFNHYSNLNTTSLIESLYDHISNRHGLVALVPDAFLFSDGFDFKNVLSKVQINKLELLPSGIESSSSPKRKTVIFATYGYVDSSPNAEVIQHKLYKNDSRTIARKPFKMLIERSDIFNSDVSLREWIFTENRKQLTKSDHKEAAAKIYDYSSEIKVSYTQSGRGTKDNPIRIQAYVLFPDNGSGIRKRISSTKGSAKLPSQGKIFDWLKKYLFSKRKNRGATVSIQEEVSLVFVPAYEGKPVTLKTFLYIHPEILLALPEYSSDLFRSVGESFLSDMFMNHVTDDLLLTFISNGLDESRFTIRQFLSVFSAVFTLAIDHRNCLYNPAAELFKNSSYENLGLSSVKDSLTKKFFYLYEIKKIISHANRLISSGKDVGLGISILLRLYLGIEANIVAGLLWKDVVFDPDGISYITTNRQVDNGGKTFLPFSSIKYRRLLPLRPFIRDVLLKEKERQLDLFAKGNETYLEGCTVIHGEDFVINGQASVYSPAKLNAKIRKLIKKIGMNPDVLYVPDDRFGSVETNIAYYTGDIFKANYRHYLLKENRDIDPGYLYYLLGNTIQMDTLSNHYFDYTDSPSLEICYDLQPTYEGEGK
ncbi:MAG: hypothetical protein IKE50_04300 [Erysipelotrichaceae bacterium]|nr:hypothetical protein [Erysipelotrichaceae bacterium]